VGKGNAEKWRDTALVVLVERANFQLRKISDANGVADFLERIDIKKSRVSIRCIHLIISVRETRGVYRRESLRQRNHVQIGATLGQQIAKHQRECLSVLLLVVPCRWCDDRQTARRESNRQSIAAGSVAPGHLFVNWLIR